MQVDEMLRYTTLHGVIVLKRQKPEPYPSHIPQSNTFYHITFRHRCPPANLTWLLNEIKNYYTLIWSVIDKVRLKNQCLHCNNTWSKPFALTQQWMFLERYALLCSQDFLGEAVLVPEASFQQRPVFRLRDPVKYSWGQARDNQVEKPFIGLLVSRAVQNTRFMLGCLERFPSNRISLW